MRIDARKLHQKLGVKEPFEDWIEKRIKETGMIRGVHYVEGNEEFQEDAIEELMLTEYQGKIYQAKDKGEHLFFRWLSTSDIDLKEEARECYPEIEKWGKSQGFTKEETMLKFIRDYFEAKVKPDADRIILEIIQEEKGTS